MSVSTLDQIVTHLQFLGYDVSQQDEVRIARHTKKANVILRPFKGGILVTALHGCKDNMKPDKAGLFRLSNLLNTNAAVARFYIDKDSDLVVEAWYPDSYEREKFSLFWESWESDSLTLLLANADETLKYLK